MTDTISAAMADAQNLQTDTGRVDVPSIVRDYALTIRHAAANIDRTLNGHWTTPGKMAQAEEDLLRLAECALAAHRALRVVR